MTDKSIKIPINKVKTTNVDSGDLVNRLSDAGFEVSSVKGSLECKEIESLQKGLMKVSFAKFVKLVSNWEYDQLLKNYQDKDIIIDSDLLIDLASFKSEFVEEEVDLDDNTGMSGVVTGVLIGVMISLILFLIFIR